MNNYIVRPKTTDQLLLTRYCSFVGIDTGGTRETSELLFDDFEEHDESENLKEKIYHRLEHDRQEIADRAQAAYSKETMAKKYMEEYDRNGHRERILLIDVNCKGSSTGKIVYDLYSSIRASGRSASICYGRGEKIEEKDIHKFGVDWETKFHGGMARLTGYNGYFSPVSTQRLIRFIEEFKPDLIHMHELHAYFVNIKPLVTYIKAKRIPLIWTFHCEYMYTGKCGYAYECTNFQYECGNCPAVRDYPKSLFFDKTKQMLKMKKELLNDLDFTIITPSQWLADRVEVSFLRDKEIKVIHNGIDTDVFHPTDASELRCALKIKKDTKIFLFVAPDVMSVRKGGHWILKLAKKMIDYNCVFILVGNGTPPELKPINTIFVGAVKDQSELVAYYSIADCFLLCSEKETYSMTCAEALCCGIPVIGFKCGAPETVFAEPDAKFVNYGDLEQIEVLIKENIL